MKKKWKHDGIKEDIYMTFLSLRIKDSVVAQSLFMKNKNYDYTYRG